MGAKGSAGTLGGTGTAIPLHSTHRQEAIALLRFQLRSLIDEGEKDHGPGAPILVELSNPPSISDARVPPESPKHGQIIAVSTVLVAAFFGWAIARRILELRLEERVSERTRIARALHDTLLQSFQGLMLHLQVVDNLLPSGEAKEQLDRMLDAGCRRPSGLTQRRQGSANQSGSSPTRRSRADCKVFRSDTSA